MVFRGEAERSAGRRVPKAPRNTMPVRRPHFQLMRPKGGGSFVARLAARFVPTLRTGEASPKKLVKARRGWGSPLSKQPEAAGRSTPPHHSRAQRAERQAAGSPCPEETINHTQRPRWQTRDASIQPQRGAGCQVEPVGGGRQSRENLRVIHSERWRGMCFGGCSQRDRFAEERSGSGAMSAGVCAHGVTPRSQAGRRVRGFSRDSGCVFELARGWGVYCLLASRGVWFSVCCRSEWGLRVFGERWGFWFFARWRREPDWR